MSKHILSLVFLVASLQSLSAQNSTLSGYIRDEKSQEALTGATVFVTANQRGTAADENGFYSLELPTGDSVALQISFVGYKIRSQKIKIKEKMVLDFLLSPESELEEVTVSAVRTNARIEDIATRVEVLGLEEVTEENGVKPGNIMSLLGDIAGIQMQQVSASSGNTLARIQGLNGRYTQLLKDGMPLFGGLSGSFGILQIPPLDLKQIEIIKGSVSTLYGGDAIGGIINLVSKDPNKERELTFTANQSTLLETNVNGYFSKKYEKIGVTFFVGQTFQKQGDVDKDGLSDVPKVGSTVIHPKVVFYLNPQSTLTLNYTATFDRRKGGNMAYFPAENNNTLFHVDNKIQRHSADAKYFYEFSKKENLTVKASNSQVSQTVGTREYTFDASQSIYYSEISYFKQLEKMNFVTGININGDIFKNRNPALLAAPAYTFQTLGAFFQHSWNPIEKLTVESGFRLDYHSLYGFLPLPRLSLMYKFNPQVTARINGGLGYKVPTAVNYLDLERNLTQFGGAYKRLEVEKSQGINADINFQKLFSNRLSLTFNQSFFFTRLNRPVVEKSGDLYRFLVNEDKSLQTSGLQSYLRMKYEAYELYLGYVFTDVQQKFDINYSRPPVTPRHNFSTTMFYELNESFRIGLESSLIAGQLDENYQPTKDYFLMAAMAQYNFRNLTFVLNGENLLDVRQSKFGKIYEGTVNNPYFLKLYAPIDGRVINFSVRIKL